MPTDPLMLQYLQSIETRTASIDGKIDNMGSNLSERLDSLEATRNQQRGIMIAGGSLVTLLSGMAAWLARVGGH
jgi:hypothetical protein